MEVPARLRAVLGNIAFILGVRPGYQLENLLATMALIEFVLGYMVLGPTLPIVAVAAGFLLSPVILQWHMKRTGRIDAITIPLYTVLVSTIVSMMYPPLLIPTIINAIFVEDFTIYFTIDVVKVKRTLRVLIVPIQKRELIILVGISTASALIAFYITGSLWTITYALISYAMIAYSVILVPIEYQALPYRAPSFLEEVSRRIFVLYLLFVKIYYRPGIRRLGEYAGMIGYQYERFTRRMAGAFTLSIYIGLAIAPLASLFIGWSAYLLPVIFASTALLSPYLILTIRRSSRSGKITRNLLLILSYIASMKAVAESLTNMMLNLKTNINLAKLFGLEGEAKLFSAYHNIDEATAEERYTNSIPEDFLRDTIRTMLDIEQNEGVGAAFRSVVNRLRDYTSRFIDRVTASFETMASNTISVAILVQTVLPILMFLFSPMLVPIVLLVGAIISVALITSISMHTLPDLPSEYVHTRPRWRRASLIFALTASALTIVEAVLAKEILLFLIPLNAVVAFITAFWYVSHYDLTLNDMFLDKFSDLLVLFNSSLARTNSVEQSMLELSQHEAFPKPMKEQFHRLANMFSVVNVQRITYRGPYWVKYFTFLSSIAAQYGVTPRELYKVISNFMLEFKRFFNTVRNFGRTLLFMIFISLGILNVEIIIASQFLKAFSKLQEIGGVGGAGVTLPFPVYPEETINFVVNLSYVTLFVLAILNGLALAKATTGTIRNGKYVLILFTAQLLLMYIGRTTGFGITILKPGTIPSPTAPTS